MIDPKKTAAGNAPEAYRRSHYPSRDNLHAGRTVEPSTATELALYRKIEPATRVKTPRDRQNRSGTQSSKESVPVEFKTDEPTPARTAAILYFACMVNAASSVCVVDSIATTAS